MSLLKLAYKKTEFYMTVFSFSEESRLPLCDLPYGEATKQETKGSLSPETSEELTFLVQEPMRK